MMAELQWSIFGSHAANRIMRSHGEWSALVDLLKRSGPHPNKASCPWIKLASFGDVRAAGGSLRNNANVQVIYGLEGDYDAGLVSLEDALAMLESAGIRAAVYTSPSHTPQFPRWRVLAPLNNPALPEQRESLLARLNGALNGILAPESFTLSQSYYYGQVDGAPEYRVLVTFDDTDDGTCVDDLHELDAIAIGRRSIRPVDTAQMVIETADPAEVFGQRVMQLGRRLKTGDGRREMLKSYVASRSARGIRGADLMTLVNGICASYFDPADPIDDGDIAGIAAWASARDVRSAEEAGRMVAGLTPDPIIATESMIQQAAQEQAMVIDQVPVELLALPGVMGECMAWMTRTAQRPQPLLSMAATLSLFATALSTKVASPTRLRTNLYLVSVAGTSSGKDHGRKCLARVLQAARLDHLIGGDDLASGAGLLSRAHKCPRTVFQLDEFGLMLQSIRSKNAGAHLASIVKNLMILFGSTDSIYRGTEYADQKVRQRMDIEYPCVNVHATTTGEQFFPALGSADVTSGALNRLLVLVCPEVLVPRQKPANEDPPESVVKWIEQVQLLQHDMLGMTPAAPIIVDYTDEADTLIEQFGVWVDEYRDKAENPQTKSLWGRAFEFSVKLALIYAVTQHPDSQALADLARRGGLRIDANAARWGVAFTKHFVGAMEKELSARMGDSDFDILVKECVRQITRKGQRGLTNAELGRYCPAYGGKEPRIQDAIHVAILRREAAAQVVYPPASGRGKSRNAWVATQFVEGASGD